MRYRFFVVDDSAKVHAVSQKGITEVWYGERSAKTLKAPIGRLMRLVSVVSDNNFRRPIVYLCNIDLDRKGMFTERARIRLVSLHQNSKPSSFTVPGASDHDPKPWREQLDAQIETWPAGFGSELANALDLPLAEVAKCVNHGGPLVIGDLTQLSLAGLARYWQDDFDEAEKPVSRRGGRTRGP